MFTTSLIPNKKVVYQNKNTTHLDIIDSPIKLQKSGTNYGAKPNEIIVKIHTSCFNPVDILLKNSVLPITNVLWNNFGLCHDYSGTVVAIGNPSNGKYPYKVGDKVCGHTNAVSGCTTLAEYAVFDTNKPSTFSMTTVPKNLTMNEAGSFALVYSTACQMIDAAKITHPNTKVLVNGASTSVGKYVIQILKLNPNVTEVVGICSGKSEAIVKPLGVDKIIDYKTTDNMLNLVLEHCKDRRFDTYLDCCGNDKLMVGASQFLVKNGYQINIAGGKKSNLSSDSGLSLATLATIKTVILGKLGLSPINFVTLLVKCGFGFDQVIDRFESGKIKPFIDTIFPFDQYQQAYELVTSGKNNGKVGVQVEE